MQQVGRCHRRQPAQIADLLEVFHPQRVPEGVPERGGDRTQQPRRRLHQLGHGVVEVCPGRRVEQHGGQHPFGRAGGEVNGHPPAHRMAGEDGLPHPECVQRAQNGFGAIGEAARVRGQLPGVAVPGGIDGDDQESLTGDSAEHPQVGAPAEQQRMHEDQGYALPADREADSTAVVEFDDVMGQADTCCLRHCAVFVIA